MYPGVGSDVLRREQDRLQAMMRKEPDGSARDALAAKLAGIVAELKSRPPA